MTEFKVTVRGNDGFLRGIWYFPTEQEAKRWAASWSAKGWTVAIEQTK